MCLGCAVGDVSGTMCWVCMAPPRSPSPGRIAPCCWRNSTWRAGPWERQRYWLQWASLTSLSLSCLIEGVIHSFILWFMCLITASRTDSLPHFAHLFILFILWLAHSLTLINLFSHSHMYLVTHAVTCLFVHSFVYAFIYSFMFVYMKLCSSVCQSPWCL